MTTNPAPPLLSRQGWEPGDLAEVLDAGALRSLSLRRARGGRRVQLAAAAGDALGAAVASLLAASSLPWVPGPAPPWERYRFALLAWAVTVAALALKGANGAPARRVVPRVADDLGPLVAALATAALVLLAADSVGPFLGRMPPSETGIVLGAAAFVVPAFRQMALVVASRDRANVARVLVVGAGPVADDLETRLSRSPLVEVVRAVDDLPRGVEDLPRLCASEGIDRVVIAFSGNAPAHQARALRALQGVVDIDVVVRYYELVNWDSRLTDVTGLCVLSVGQPAGPIAAVVKRCLDLGVSAIALVLLAPLFLAIAVAVRCDSPGPVFFRQTRVGRAKSTFRIFKFRTLQACDPTRADRAPSWRAPSWRTPLDGGPDPALVTRVGLLLRRSSLDELPQLLNVLRGEMSLVGPRPFVPEECLALDASAERRFDVRPGITGMWQVCGQHGVTFEELCRLDVQYATSWSLRGDLRILARTPARVLHGSTPGR